MNKEPLKNDDAIIETVACLLWCRKLTPDEAANLIASEFGDGDLGCVQAMRVSAEVERLRAENN